MSNSNQPEPSTPTPLALSQKKETSVTTRTPPNGAALGVTAPSRCYALSLPPTASCTLAIFGLAQDLHIHGTLCGLPVGTQNIVRIRAADHASARELKRYVQQFSDKEDSVTVLGPKTSTPPDYRRPEGRALIGKVKAPETLMVAVPPAPKKVRWHDAEMYAFKDAIEFEGVLSIAIFQGLSKDDEVLLPTYFDAVLTVAPCEPDETFASATFVAPMAGSLLAATGHKPQIENIRMAAGRIERQCQPCVSPDKLTREMHRMREEGLSLTEISDKLGFDKSTISRRLGALPFHLRRHCM